MAPFLVEVIHFLCQELSPGLKDIAHFSSGLVAVIGTLVRLISVVEAALPDILWKEGMSKSFPVLGPGIEACSGAAMQRHNAGCLRCSVDLFRINPADTVNFALAVVHSFQEAREGFRRHRLEAALKDTGKEVILSFIFDSRHGFQQPDRNGTQRGLSVKRQAFGLDLHA